jgi:hypothetical protein
MDSHIRRIHIDSGLFKVRLCAKDLLDS